MKERALIRIGSYRQPRKRRRFPLDPASGGPKLGVLLLILCSLMLGAVSTARAGEFCSAAPYFGVIDGDVLGTPPVQITIDTDCTFQNWPPSNPLTTTINFQTTTDIYLIVFDNVWYDGNLACANIPHKLWVVNSPAGAFSGSCQNIMIPAETIYKQTPGPTAMIGLPFTYLLTIPAMNFPIGADPSPNDIGSIDIRDDLDLAATGADLTLVSVSAYYKSSPTTTVPVTNLGDTKHLHFTLPDILAGEQIVVEVEVVLDDTPANVPGTQFTNTATWEFSRWVDLDEDGLVDPGEFFNPLPGESGISEPMTIVAPSLVVTKTSPATAMNLGDTAQFTIDVQNSGGGNAWNAAILDTIPVGMCDFNPLPTLNARIIAADGSTVVKVLSPVTDYTATYGSCQLSLTLTGAAGPIAPDQHLVITYDSEIDPASSLTSPIDGTVLTNVAGAIRWYSADSTHTGRREFVRSLTDGTPTIIDHQDSQSVTAALHGYYFEKTVQNLTSLANPATSAAPGDTLRYRLHVFNVDQTINTVFINDTLDLSSFDPASFSIVSIVTGTQYTATYDFDSLTGLLRVYGSPDLDVKVGGEIEIEFDISLVSDITNTMVSNQATLDAAGGFIALSDDPYINGVALPDDPGNPATIGDEDPTVVTVTFPVAPMKAITQPAAAIGEQFEYIITVPEAPATEPMYDVQIRDTLPPNLKFVSARVMTGGSWQLSSSVTGSVVTIEDTTTGGIDIPARSLTNSGQARIGITVELLNSVPNQSSVLFTNSATYTYNRANSIDSTKLAGSTGTSAMMAVTEPLLTASKTVSFVSPTGKLPSDPATVGDVLEYSVTISNSGSIYASTAFDVNIVDTLPTNVTLGTGTATAEIGGAPVSGFVAAPSMPSGSTLVWGRENGDGNLDIPPGESLVLTYQVTVVDAISTSAFTNTVYVDWTSIDGDYPIDPVNNPAPGRERTGADCSGTGLLNDYCLGPVSVTVNTVEDTTITKAVSTDSYAENPPSAADPVVRVGDTVTYDLTLHLQEYTTQNVAVEDRIPAGMAFESFSIIGGLNFSYSLLLQPVSNATGTVRWEFGDIINAPDGIPTNDDLVIRYVAKVLTAAPPTGVGYATSIKRDNRARLSYWGGDPDAYPGRLTTTERIDVRQPRMTAIAKTGSVVGRTAIGDGSSTAPYEVYIASDTMAFQVESCNVGLAPAYNVELADTLANELDEGSITAPVVAIDGTTLVSGYTFTAPASRGGSMQLGLTAPVEPGQCLTVGYTIGFYTDLTGQTTWSNEAALTRYASLPANGRIYAPARSAQVWMTNVVSSLALTKKLNAPASGEAAVGETAVYEITVPGIPANITLPDVEVSDTLHPAFIFVSATATLDGAPLAVTTVQSGPDLTWSLGTIVAGQQAVITLTVRVDNKSEADRGTSVINSAFYTIMGAPPATPTDGAASPLTIVEPSVSVAKSVANVTRPGAAPQAGDILRYTVDLTAASGADLSSAFDADIVDTLSLGLAYQPGTSMVSGATNSITDPAVSGDGSTAPQTLTWDPAGLTAAIDIAEGATVAVTYDVLVLNSVVAGQILSNDVTVRWTSLDGAFGYERTGVDGIGGLNDYVATAAAPPLTVPIPVLTVQKTVDRPVANPGDLLHYTIVIQNPAGIRVDNFSLDDEIDRLNVPPAFQPGSIGNVSVPAGAVFAVAGGTLTATGLNVGPNETLTVSFDALLATNLRSGTVVLNQAALQGPWSAPLKSDDPALPGPEDPTQTVIPANGVVYASDTRAPLAGATLTMRLASTGADLPAACFIDPSQQNQVTQPDGAYKFDLQFDPANCPDGADYLIAVTAAPAGYLAGQSLVIPPSSDASTAAYSVLLCPADAVPATSQCEAQASAAAPAGAITKYYLHLTLDSTANQIYNNHIPVDPYIEEKISITKTTPLINVTRGQLVPYTIAFKNTLHSTLPSLGIVDTIPAGFKYVVGSSRLDGTPVEPNATGRDLAWNDVPVGYNQQHMLRLLLVVGAGVAEGEYVNRAHVIDMQTGGPFSEVATATVRVIPDPTVDCTDVIGKVFDDRNLSGSQEQGEAGLAGVRVVTARGLIATTDEYGRFHITCAMVPEEDRGSNFILKLDDRTLPTGYRVTTENPRVQRATRGKMLRFRFGATIHRVVSLGIADGVFEQESSILRTQWRPRIDLLLKELRKGPSVLRLSYLAEVEDAGLVSRRIKAVKQEIIGKWNGGYRLAIETEVFWRRGSPP